MRAQIVPASDRPAISFDETPSVLTVRVPATGNPYLAGLAAGTNTTYGDRAPQQSPVLVEFSLRNAAYVTFSAAGNAQHHPFRPPRYDPPNGSIAVSHDAEHGISAVTAPIDSLIGVFLDDDRPESSPPPPPINSHTVGWNFISLEPQLKQVFFIGVGRVKASADGSSKKTLVARRFLVPKGATRLFLAVMDQYEWSNNEGYFDVAVTLQRTDTSSSMFSVDSSASFAKWSCLPDRSRCTPDRAAAEATGPGRYHVILPAQLEWPVSVPVPDGATVSVVHAVGTVCLDSPPQSTNTCNGPAGNGQPAGPEFLAPDKTVGELIVKTLGGRTYFSVNGPSGPAFQDQQGYFEFDVTIKPAETPAK